uniref:HNH endonuclease n=1 Tax=Iridovirus LCIVAC01 TaxID=2506607 RepID=A0A481YR98_9VIRU|nr:MAG: HNH endonuclease [Iridovirus LCIVAC01]
MFEKNKEEKEQWITISENKNYEVSNLAQIRNEKTKRILKKYIRTDGYEGISLSYTTRGKTYSVHKLVAQAFIPNPNNFPQVNHKDLNRANNRVSNLEWVTQSMNIKHSVKKGRNTYKRAVWRRDPEGNEVIFDSITEAAKIVGCSKENIFSCISRRTNTAVSFEWGYVEERIKEEARKDIASMEIKDYPYYLIYNNGQIYSDYIKGYLKPRISNGYYRIGLSNDNGRRKHRVHILVAQHFCDNPDNKPIVNHIDGNKLNNHYTNLEWVTYSENSKHAHNLGLIKRVSKRVHQYAREDKDKLVILRTFNNSKEAAEFVKLESKTKATISSILKNISGVCIGVKNTAYGYRWGQVRCRET